MSNIRTIEFVNNSGSANKSYNVFSAKALVEGGGNTSVKSVVFFKTRTISEGQRAVFKFDNSFYGFLGTQDNKTIYTQSNKKVTIGSDREDGDILLLDKTSTFTVIPPDDEVKAPGLQQFKIRTNANLNPDKDVIGVSRGRYNGSIVAAATDVVDLKSNVTYTFTTSNAVYIKASNFTEATVQTAPDDEDKSAVKVEFAGQMKKAVVTEDDKGNFTVSYSRD
ncbi:hypothetical protein VFPPC_03840 [Pochonia chlamydosporia 170]|uniref:Uncharacterized protein n=1 Tax=Pochonia chlamydosporia 170 TaxID=1380566 RepID=A0A179F2R5_METCM|nr:hypothetical protein VFPPC_03840 [Pochonia chlamydosporia 170]OAQ59620.1 hypothetical protein VFPPC_03840 [Pochonia chlamydosporia 170]